MTDKHKNGSPRTKVKSLRSQKWLHAKEVIEDLNKLGFKVIQFESSQTPHLRIGSVDYWPATTRFYDARLKVRGRGSPSLTTHLLKQKPDNRRKADFYRLSKLQKYKLRIEELINEEEELLDKELSSRIDREK